MREKIKEMILKSIKETSIFQKNPGENISEETVLFGSGGIFDSMTLVTFIIDIEQKITDEFSVNVAIVDERSFSQKDTPFRNVGYLVDYIVTLLNKDRK